MNGENLQNIWYEKYQTVPEQFAKTSQIKLVATGFNTNIDAVVKISGKKISELAEKYNITSQVAENCPTVLDSPKAVVCGIVKCFVNGIAEEWLTTSSAVDDWIEQNIGTDKLQMGGQAGIIANVLALTGVQQTLVNTAAHPKLLSDQFIKNESLSAIDENGKLVPAYKINRKNDMPPVHRIIEFDKDDVLILDGKKYVCPKSNRFIATYDELNAKMQINKGFEEYLTGHGFDYFIFAGYNLLSGNNGFKAAENSVKLLQKLKEKEEGILHLEIASTQDKVIRRYTFEKIAAFCDSLGLNERETLDACEVLFPDIWENLKNKRLNAVNLFEAMVKIKECTKVKRIQLHIFGLYICLQDKDYKFTPKQSLNGMLCAAVAAASKACLGYLQNPEDLTSVLNENCAKLCLSELQELSEYLNMPKLSAEGMAEYKGFDLIAVPTLLAEKPKTLVGMGDTISSLSLVCAI